MKYLKIFLFVFMIYISFSGNGFGSVNIEAAGMPDLKINTDMQVNDLGGGKIRLHADILNYGTADTNYKGVNTFKNLFQTAIGFDGGSVYANTPQSKPQSVVSYPVDYLPGFVSSTEINPQPNFYVEIPYTSQAGPYFFRACADKSSASDINGVIDESNEDNNCGSWQEINIVTNTVFGADLTTAMNFNSHGSYAKVNALVNFSALIKNSGTDTTNNNPLYNPTGKFTTEFQVTKDISNLLNSSYFSSYDSNPLVAGDEFNLSRDYGFTSTGTYYVRACTDFDGKVYESNEGNNCTFPWTTMTISPTISNLKPSYVEDVSISQDSVTGRYYISLSADVKNEGDRVTESDFANNFIIEGNNLILGSTSTNSIKISELGPGATGTASISNIDSQFFGMTAGSYTYKFCADTNVNTNPIYYPGFGRDIPGANSVTESDESDNCSNTAKLILTAPQSSCLAPLSKEVTVPCDTKDGFAAISGSVTVKQTKVPPSCIFESPVTNLNSNYVKDNCVYPEPSDPCGGNGANNPPLCNMKCS